ncbi:MCP four helix bundle domain-containing protein [Desulfoprunum benzoelyticum]|uniref:Methyl-accepting chemotaxis protein n=1 Tax=Desulfoprunum benzoelyticum TaxID=1506996 RepID=A0A840V223_9BACT|nr:methyl-accepting chemotaxis protein [Desulfoprunum benzoelyticum]MBB5347910.1 methyl-accepting chemotaxis protein [Desulfoprunum benzoelyticum]MBM9530333.1 MCP four helix bundle domain-containing protein [Desulfoprunum benzoelyticum]
MKWFVDLATRTKLFFSFGLMIVLMLVLIIAAYIGLSAIHQSQERLFRDDFLPSIELLKLRSSQNRAHAQLLEMMMTPDRGRQQALERDIAARTREVDEGLKLVAASLQGHPRELRQFDELVAALTEYRRVREQQISLIYDEKSSEAESLDAAVQDKLYNRVRTIAVDLGTTAIAQATERVVAANARAERLSRIFIGISILVFVFGVVVALYLSRIIAQPLREITTAAQRIASGDLEVATRSKDRQDEVGDLAQAFATMVRYLQEMAVISRKIAQGDLTATVRPVSDRDVLGNAFADMTGYLREMATVSKQIAEGDLTVPVKPASDNDILRNAFANMVTIRRRITQEISDGINVLASSASEILASTTQIAAGMSETAASVTQTTATVEQIKQTALLSSKKSRGVSENAQKSALVAEQGKSTVSETIDGITRIKELMETVAESVVMLSEQTQAIGEIITVVTDLAQQSNLLAVNAAIEASKAGEHGKGFAVVAQEIKSLADQSKQATEQVRKILGDIQKATGKSVLAAEQVSKAVEGGVKQASESGESIRKLAESISGAAQAAEQIAVSSQQQLAGMEQVAIAMENIKQATHQNVLGTKQAEQAAHTLNELGQKLKEMVSRSKV